MNVSRARLMTMLLFALSAAGCGGNVSVSRNDGEIAIKIDQTPVVEGSGKSTTETRTVQGFRSVSAAHAIEVTVDVSGTESVSVECDDNLLSLIETAVKGENLHIRVAGSLKTKNPIRVKVSAKQLSGVKAESSARITTNKLQGDKMNAAASSSGQVMAELVDGDQFDVAASSSGSVTARKVAGKQLQVEVSSSGQVTAEGQVDRLKVEASSSGRFDGAKLVSRTAQVECSSSGSAKVNATEEVTGAASSSGSVNYVGQPTKVSVATSSAGSVSQLKK